MNHTHRSLSPDALDILALNSNHARPVNLDFFLLVWNELDDPR